MTRARMSPLIFLIMLVQAASGTAGDGRVETYQLHAAIGSSVLFPEVKIDKYTMYDLSREKGGLVVTCHDDCTVRDPYTHRGHFDRDNGTFLLNELRTNDNGTFESKINFTVKAKIHLHVMTPVSEPVLKQEVRGNGSQCLIVFTCQAEGDGPLNVTFLRNDKEILHDGNSTDNSSSLSMDACDPAMSGRISCTVANPVSSKTSATFHLLPPAPVTEPVLKQEVRGNGSQCLIVFTCQAEGDGPLNVTFLRNDEEILHNEVTTDNSSSLSMDACDPATSGRISCTVANPVSSKTSATFHLLPPATLIQRILRLIAIASLIHWIFVVCILCKKYISRKLPVQRRKGNEKNDNVDQDSRIPNKHKKASTAKKVFYKVDILLGFTKEIALVVTCAIGEFISTWWCIAPVVFLLCRLIFELFAFMNRNEETCRPSHRIFSKIRVFCERAMIFSNLIAIPAFSIAILVMFNKLYRLPCERRDRYPFILSSFCVLLFVVYLVVKNIKTKEKGNTEGTEDPAENRQLVKEPNGDIERAEDNRNPNCNGANVGRESHNQSDILRTMENLENPMIPKNKEYQPTEVPRNSPSTAAPNHVNSDVTKDPDGRCLPTLKKEEAGNG